MATKQKGSEGEKMVRGYNSVALQSSSRKIDCICAAMIACDAIGISKPRIVPSYDGIERSTFYVGQNQKGATIIGRDPVDHSRRDQTYAGQALDEIGDQDLNIKFSPFADGILCRHKGQNARLTDWESIVRRLNASCGDDMAAIYEHASALVRGEIAITEDKRFATAEADSMAVIAGQCDIGTVKVYAGDCRSQFLLPALFNGSTAVVVLYQNEGREVQIHRHRGLSGYGGKNNLSMAHPAIAMPFFAESNFGGNKMPWRSTRDGSRFERGSAKHPAPTPTKHSPHEILHFVIDAVNEIAANAQFQISKTWYSDGRVPSETEELAATA